MGIYIEIDAQEAASEKKLIEVVSAKEKNNLGWKPNSVSVCYYDNDDDSTRPSIHCAEIEGITYNEFLSAVKCAQENPGFIPDMSKENIASLLEQVDTLNSLQMGIVPEERNTPPPAPGKKM